jgi:hypothetical protein
MEIPTAVLRIYFIAVIGSWLLYMVERFAISLFQSFDFCRVGIKVKTFQDVDVNPDNFEIGKVYETKHAKLKRVNKNSCLFYCREGFFQINTPFPIKGEILRNESGTLLIWRIPLGSTLFFSLCLLGWFSPLLFGTFQLNASQIFSTGIAFGLLATFVGIGFMWFLYASSSRIEQKRVRLALSELEPFSFHP